MCDHKQLQFVRQDKDASCFAASGAGRTWPEVSELLLDDLRPRHRDMPAAPRNVAPASQTWAIGDLPQALASSGSASLYDPAGRVQLRPDVCVNYRLWCELRNAGVVGCGWRASKGDVGSARGAAGSWIAE